MILRKIKYIFSIIMLLATTSLVAVTHVYAARGAGALSDYTISFISPYCFLVSGQDLNLQIKKQANNSVSSYTTQDNTIEHIVFDLWDDFVYGSDFNWDTSSHSNVDATQNANIRLFYKSSTKTVYALSPNLIASRDCGYMFYNLAALKTVEFKNFNSIESTSNAYMFANCSQLTTISYSSNISTNLSTTTDSMFLNCSSLSSVDTSLYKTPKVTTMNSMFKNCSALTTINVEGFEAKSVQNFNEMFAGCTNLGTLNFNNFVTDAATSMASMFLDCPSLTSLSLPKFNTTLVTDMSAMFKNCTNLQSLNISSFTTANVTTFSQMFYNCSSLSSLTLTNITTDSATNLSGMFAKCGVTTLGLTTFDTKKVTNMSEMFYDMPNLTTITVTNLWNIDNVTSSSNMFANSTNIVGGMGTVYNASKIDKEYAFVDLPNEPGYLTASDVQYKGVFIYDEFGTLLSISYVGTESSYTLPTSEEYDHFTNGSTNYNPGQTVTYDIFTGVESVEFTVYEKKFTATFTNGNYGNYVNKTVTYTYKGHSFNVSSGGQIHLGATVSISVSLNTTSNNYSNPTVAVSASSGENVQLRTITQYSSYSFTMPSSNVTLTFNCSYSPPFCIAEGTMITKATGEQVAIENIALDDEILIFNHETGLFDHAQVNFIECDGTKEYNVINLVFSNGTTSRIIQEHGFFDLTENKYVYIHEDDCQDYIGHSFVCLENENGEYSHSVVTLVNAFVTTEIVGCYSIVTKYHLDYYTDSILSMPGGIAGLFNIFDYDNSLKYDQQDFDNSIAEYGLFTYEDFENYITEETFNLYPAPYLKVALAKGLITWEGIYYLINRYC